MPENENDKTVELDTSGPGANVAKKVKIVEYH